MPFVSQILLIPRVTQATTFFSNSIHHCSYICNTLGFFIAFRIPSWNSPNSSMAFLKMCMKFILCAVKLREFWELLHVLSSSLEYPTEQFHWPKSFSPLELTLLSELLASTHLLVISIALPFLDGPITGIIHCVAFLGWLLSLNSMHSSWMCVCWWLADSFLSIAE